jgi:DnaJ-class molecular chaperone
MIRLLDGEIYCPQCGGKRALGWCRDCDGTGTVKKDRLGQPERPLRPLRRGEEYPIIDGTTCPTCTGNRVIACPKCGGKGYIKQP